VFTSERGAPITTAGFARMIERCAAAKLPFKVHPHMLRHACGGYLLRDNCGAGAGLYAPVTCLVLPANRALLSI
jgi:site-specific recombinase XerD